jgi:hypothetical protein
MTMTGHSEQTIATPLHGPPFAAFGCRIDTSVPDEPRSFPNFPQKRIAFGGDIDIGKRTGGARGLKLDHKTGSLTPGKEADIILLDANAINVAPLNHVPGAVVTLLERSNVSTVLCAGKVRKWQGALLGHDIAKLRVELEGSRDYLIEAAGIKPRYF